MAFNEYEKTVLGMDGYEELKKVRAAWNNYYKELRQFISVQQGQGNPPEKPAVKIADLAEKYPKATWYLLAEDYSISHNHMQSCLGYDALVRIMNGEDGKKVIAQMTKRWENYCKERVWL